MNPELHDRLLKQMSDGELAVDGFPIWASADEILVEEKMTTFTDEETKALVEKAVADATADLQAKLDEVTEAKKALETKDVEATLASLNDEIKDLQSKLDAAVLAAEAAKTEREELVAYLEEEQAKVDREAEIARLRDERVSKVAEVATFPETYVAENADRWARMSEEDFEQAIADYSAVAAKKESKTDDTIPEGTSLKASKESKQGNGGSARSAIFAMHLRGVDARHVL